MTPNIRERIERDVRALAPAQYKVKVTLPEDPVGYAWRGGSALAEDSVLKDISVSRSEFLEKGHAVCHQTFYI